MRTASARAEIFERVGVGVDESRRSQFAAFERSRLDVFEFGDLAAEAADDVMVMCGAGGEKFVVCVAVRHIDAADEAGDLERPDRSIERGKMRCVGTDALCEVGEGEGSVRASKRRDRRETLWGGAKAPIFEDGARIERVPA